MSAASVLAAYRFPEVVEHSCAGLTPELFFDGTAQTLYVVAGDRDQQLLTPLIVALLSSLLEGARERATRVGPLDPTLRVLMDEAANIAPLRDLPRILSQSAGFGIRIATVWQSLAQLQERFGRAGDTVLANSTAKLFMGPVTDSATSEYAMSALSHGARAAADVAGTEASSVALRRLNGDRALVLAGARATSSCADDPMVGAETSTCPTARAKSTECADAASELERALRLRLSSCSPSWRVSIAWWSLESLQGPKT